ncbi:MAG: sigma-70 family RNA polymerase sigma factor [Brevundimonas sp.]|nr:MAG: sigma-70 family RNA polymerase sigma factor [Brevundimonas sp.]
MTDSLERTTEEQRAWLDQLHRRYGRWLRACLHRRYGAQAAEDLVQDTWLSMSRHRAVGEVRAPKAYLLRVASHLAFRVGVARGRGQAADELASGLAGWGVQDAAQEEGVLARQIVMSLPQPLRDVFVLSRVGGLTNAQIAEQLGISPKTVEGRMTKALAHCAAQLRR